MSLRTRCFSPWLALCLIAIIEAKILQKVSDKDKCEGILSEEIINEISAYQNVVDQILNYVIEGDFKGRTYDELAKFCDTFGSRISGSRNLENSIDYMINLSREEGLSNIVTEDLEVPHWVRGEEKITMLQPRVKNIAVLGLGNSVSTPPEGISAEVVLVSNFESFSELSDDEVKGKIVLFLPVFTTYKETRPYRTEGPSKAAEKGAVAALIRSITPFSIYSPHTGVAIYNESTTKIPTAAITLEDADLITRIVGRGERVILNVTMSSTYDTKISRNTLIDFKGTKYPEKLVIVSGHIDSWDVGQGATDDGGGLFISWAAPVILNRLSLIPKRTIRAIFWTAEEYGLIGASAYEKKHRNEMENINFVMESDDGTFRPLGLTVAGTQEARCVVSEILKLFKSINATKLVESDDPGSDIGVILKYGIPGADMLNTNERRYWFHHTEGDTMDLEDPYELDLGAALWTAVAYVIADLSFDIPR